MRRGLVSTLPLVSETIVSTRLRIENVASCSPVMERGIVFASNEGRWDVVPL